MIHRNHSAATARRRSLRRASWSTVPALVALLAGVAAIPGTAVAETVPPDDSGATAASVEGELRKDLAAGGTADFWVYLTEQANLAAAAAVPDRAAQGELVHERLTAAADRSQAALRAVLDRDGAPYQPFWVANTIRVTGDAELLDRIAAMPGVAQITADRVYRIPEPVPAADEPRVASVEWGVDRVRAPEVWAEFGAVGDGILVGSIDTGVQFDHPALVNQYQGNLGGGQFDHAYHWHDPSAVCGSPSPQPCDNNGHGTHTTGTIVGDDGAGNQIGVAPGATWIAAKGCEADTCSQSALLSSGQFMLAPTDLAGENPHPDRRPHVVNNSWGGGVGGDPWYQQMVQAWVAAGIFPVFSAGNSGPNCRTAGNPGDMPESYAVGAFDIDGVIAPFSSRGHSAFGVGVVKPDVAAPGVAVRSAWLDSTYHTISGTSMAAPHVTGTVALLWVAAPGLAREVDATRELLDLTAIATEDLSCGGEPGHNNVWGHGRLDAFATVAESPRQPVGTLTGTVTGDGVPLGGASVNITGVVDRQRTTLPDGTYAATLPVGEYTVTATAFGHADRAVDVTVVAGDTTVADLDLPLTAQVTVSGRVTDGSGHGWPLYARVAADGTPVAGYTDPVTGEYRLSLPAGNTYLLRFTARYPGYAVATAVAEVGDGDLAVDVAMTVDDCLRAPGREFGARVGVFGDQGGALTSFLTSIAVPSTEYRWHDDPAEYDVIVVNRPVLPGQADFLEFLAATDAAGTGVVFLDQDDAFAPDSRFGAIHLLWRMTGTPARFARDGDAAIPELFYLVTGEHPVLTGFEVGDEIVLDRTSPFKTHAWFDGYGQDGRQVIAAAGRSDRGLLGAGIGVQEREGNRHVLLALHGASPFGAGPVYWTDEGRAVFDNALRWAAPDATFACTLVPGGLVTGHVTDLNTGGAVDQAVITVPGSDGSRGVSVPTPDDPALADGFFWLFSPATGPVEVAASARHYAPATVPAEVVAGGTVRADLALPAGALTVEPGQVSATVPDGVSADRPVTVTNTGTAPVDLSFVEHRAVPARDSGGAGVTYLPGDFSPAARPASDRAPAGAPPAPDEAVGAAPWTDLAHYPHSIMDNAAAVLDGQLYVIGGLRRNPFPGVPSAAGFVYQSVTDEWLPIADLPQARQKPELGAIDGRLYAVGGWNDALAPTATTFVYHPAADQWSRGADMPGARSAPGVAVLDGRLYVIGGCGDDFCTGTTNTWRYDPAADTWEELAPYPEPVAWLGCAGLPGQVTCTGGIDNSGGVGDQIRPSSTTASTYAYDPAGDRWVRRADLPYPNWGMAYGGANGQLVVSAGITGTPGEPCEPEDPRDPGGPCEPPPCDPDPTEPCEPGDPADPRDPAPGDPPGSIDGSTVTNRTVAYDPRRDEWRDLAPAGRPVYRGAGACGFYKVGGSMDSFGFTPLSGAEVLPGFDGCDAGTVDLPWLAADPPAATLQPGESVTVTVTLDASAVDGAGTYSAGLAIHHETPYPVDPVTVTMVVQEPISCDRTVTGVHRGPLVVADGVTCVASGAVVTGPVTVRVGAGLVVDDARITGPVSAAGATVVELTGSRLIGPVSVVATAGPVTLDHNWATGPVSLVDNTTGATPTLVSANTIVGPLSCTGNVPAPTNGGAPNAVIGRATGQCVGL